MICQVVVDKKGKFVSASFEHRGRFEESEEEPTLRSGVMVEDDQRMIEVEMPEDSLKLSTEGLVQRLEAEVKASV